MAVAKKALKNYKSNSFLGWVSSINYYLLGEPARVTKFLKGIPSDLSQEVVDKICLWLSKRESAAIERVRQQVIKTIQAQSAFASAISSKSQALYSIYTNPQTDNVNVPCGEHGAHSGVVINIPGKQALGVLSAPSPVIPIFSSEETNALDVLASNLSSLSSLTIPPDGSRNFNKFKLTVGGLGSGNITENNSNLASPESMFADSTPPPYSVNFWEELGEAPLTVYKEETPYITGSWDERNAKKEQAKTEQPKTDTTKVSNVSSGGTAPAGSTIEAKPVSKTDAHYSSVAGNKLANAARTVDGTIGYCMRGVNKSLKRAFGMNLQGLGSAYMAADALRGKVPAYAKLAKKFIEVSVLRKNLSKLPPGAIVVWDNCLKKGGSNVSAAGKKHGHISIALGNGKESSDHIQNQMVNRDADFSVFYPVES